MICFVNTGQPIIYDGDPLNQLPLMLKNFLAWKHLLQMIL